MHELNILNRLQQLNKKYFPKILSSYNDQKIIIMDKIDGYLLDDIWDKIDNKENIFVQLTEILKNINSIKPFFDFDFLRHYKNRYRYLYKKAKNNPFLER
jgi:RIO-like serine/threonine protein kinase